ncbi:MAG: flavin oxidoreductase/NADH oxidase [Candidatus Lokiarchaeota archaeon]|nr:flavin oxidoreductase/NADH oxidase [Candidatus Lokiarchaeota archaeon]
MKVLGKECNHFEPFKYKSFTQLKRKLSELNLDLSFSEDFTIFRRPLSIGNKTLPNRLAIQPMEGFDAKRDGSPSFLTVRRYARYAKGGAGLIWCEANSISEGYRSNRHQLAIHNENVDEYRSFVSHIKKISKNTLEHLGSSRQCLLILQLNHSGRYCKKEGKKYPVRAYHNNQLDEAINVSKRDGKIISDTELKQLEEKWVERALLARDAGFDGVDIKACHGYLISELLSARERKDSLYGGYNLANRTRFFLNIIKKLENHLSETEDFIITTRLGIYDGVPYPNGFGVAATSGEKFAASIDLTEPIKLIKELNNLGIRLINISAGNPHYKPHITRPYDIPVKGAKIPSEHPLCGVYRLIKMTAKIKTSIPEEIKIVGSGYSYLRQFSPYICAELIKNNEVDICGFGRMAFANPEFPRQIFQQHEINPKRVCVGCSQCSQLMKNGKSTGCVIRDAAYEMKD